MQVVHLVPSFYSWLQQNLFNCKCKMKWEVEEKWDSEATRGWACSLIRQMVWDTAAVRTSVAPHDPGGSVQPLNHSTLLLCLTITAVEAHDLSPLSSLGCISFLSWRSSRGVNGWDWGGGRRPDSVEWCLETTLRCKAENVASNFFHPPQMLARESICHTLSNLP